MRIKRKDKELMKQNFSVGIILAAGLSTRFPGNKMLHIVKDYPLISRVVNCALDSKLDKVLVVLGHMKDEIEFIIPSHPKIEILTNSDYVEGMTTSIRTGVIKAKELEADLIMIIPGDILLNDTEIINNGIKTSKKIDKPILIASFHGRRGHPIFFKKEIISELLEISEETEGMRAIIRHDPARVMTYNCSSESILFDIDTAQDLKNLNLD
ncbi:MAG: nucleotidyltransferase family protein [Candidatus Kariarchaeaceae archaeon]